MDTMNSQKVDERPGNCPEDGGPAFGHGNPEQGGDPGMSLRDYFAGQALPFALTRDYGNDWGKDGKDHVPFAVRHSYAVADAMLIGRSKATGGAQ